MPDMTPERQKELARGFALNLSANFRLPAVRQFVKTRTRSIEPITLLDLKIRTKDRKLLSLRPNFIQQWYLDDLHDKYPSFDWRRGKYEVRGLRDDVLKGRQFGFSTIILGLMFLDMSNNPLTQSLCMTDNGDRSSNLFRIIHRFYNNLPNDKKHPKKYSSKMEIEYSDTDSIISVATAGTGNVGRGGTLANLLESERAFWTNGDEVESGLFESVPLEYGNIWKETTANSYNEYFVERQREHAGESPFRPKFYSWKHHVEYAIEPPVDFEETEEERELMAEHGLTRAQLEWRRRKIRDLNKDPMKPKFDQEYPLTEALAFLHSGNPYFSRTKLAKLQHLLQGDEFRPLSDLMFSKELYPILRKLYADGELRVWTLPDDDMDYIVTCDPSEGITENGDHDKTGIHVGSVQRWEQCAVVHGLYTPGYTARILNELARWYHDGLIAVHRNNHGHAVHEALMNSVTQPDGSIGVPLQLGDVCTGIYTYHPQHANMTKAPTDPIRRVAGYPESEPTKIFMLDKLGEALDDDPGLIVYDTATVAELLSYDKKPNGGAGAAVGCHDDLVSSLALLAVLLRLQFRRLERRNKREVMQPKMTAGRRIAR